MYCTVIKHDGPLGNVENTSCKLVFSTFLECSQISGVFKSQCNTRLRLLHLLYDIEIHVMLVVKNNKTRFFYVLYPDKTWVFDQSECTQDAIYFIKKRKYVPCFYQVLV